MPPLWIAAVPAIIFHLILLLISAAARAMGYDTGGCYDTGAAMVGADGTPSWVCQGAWAEFSSAIQRLDGGTTQILGAAFDASKAIIGFFFDMDYAILQSTENTIIVGFGWIVRLFGWLGGLVVAIYLVSILFGALRAIRNVLPI